MISSSHQPNFVWVVQNTIAPLHVQSIEGNKRVAELESEVLKPPHLLGKDQCDFLGALDSL